MSAHVEGEFLDPQGESVPPAEYCPVSIGAKLIGDRWTLLIVRELIVGARGFNEIHRGLPGLNRSMLAGRLRYLERLGAVCRTNPRPGVRSAYRLTPSGSDLRDVIVAIGAWTVHWHFPEPIEVDEDVPSLLWRMYQGMRRDVLPGGKVLIEFRFPGSDPSRGWIKIDPQGSRVCLGAPEGRPDVSVQATPRVLTEVWFGFRGFHEAIAEGAVVLEGPSDVTRDLPNWFQTSAFSEMVGKRQSG